jgi:hypothetical protein
MRQIIKLFRNGSVIVTGLRGRGKDMLMSNVVVRRNEPYISNIDYGGKFLPLELDKLTCGYNTYKDFLDGTVKKYAYPYADGIDIYMSDLGIYMPSQYCSELNKGYGYIPTLQALIRQLGDSSFHCNCQNLNRVYDKVREQADQYIWCCWCKVIPLNKVLPWVNPIVIQKVRIYDKYESCLNRMLPFGVRVPLFADNNTKMMWKLQRQQYNSTHGTIKERILIYTHKSKYDTRYFKEMLNNGK